MFDQATTLRRLMNEITFNANPGLSPKKIVPPSPTPRVFAVTGGKGGVGKTLTTANLGLCFARLGMRTLLIDGDLGLANLDVVLNVRPQFTLDDVLSGDRELRDCIVTGPDGLRLIPASSGVLKIAELGRVQKLVLLDQIESLDEEFDAVFIDTAAGVSKNVQFWTSTAAEIIVVVTPEPTAMADGYATMKILNQTTGETRFKLVVNMVRSEQEGLRVYEKLSTLAADYLQVKVEFLGSVPFEESVRESVRERVPFVQKYPFSEASRGTRNIANQLLSEQNPESAKGTMQFFWRRMIENKGSCPVNLSLA